MLPDRIGRPDDPKAHQEQNLREAETIQTALGKAFDEGIGADRTIHRWQVLNIQPIVYAFIDLPLYDECAVNRCLIGRFEANKAAERRIRSRYPEFVPLCRNRIGKRPRAG